MLRQTRAQIQARTHAHLYQISNGIAGYKEENPDVSDAEAVRALLPGTKWQLDDSGELTMQMDGESRAVSEHVFY